MQTENILATLPSTDQVLKDSRSQALGDRFGIELVADIVRDQTRIVRDQLRGDPSNVSDPTGTAQPASRASLLEQIIRSSEQALEALFTPSLRPVHNLTGVIIHTNLGRAPYPQVAIDAMAAVSSGACNLEYDLRTGKRGRRDDHVEQWLCRLTGAEAAITVNNNAAAVLLVLNTLAERKKVPVSRGELIEIGGSFRMPAIMQKAGCKLIEVGTTNRTHLYDYENAIGKKTAALMKVHTSNFEVKGFNNSVTAAELAPLARHHNLPLIDDMGSGSLIDLQPWGLPAERTTAQAIAEGVDLITFSGDKLLGGPQCGVIAGRADLVKRIEKNPLKRAMRLDKVTLAALEAILKLYTRPDKLTAELPALHALTRPPAAIEGVAHELSAWLNAELGERVQLAVSASECQIGSGALPTRALPSFAVSLKSSNGHSASAIARAFRQLRVPVIGRVNDNAFWLDCRNLQDFSSFAQPLYPVVRTLSR